MWFGTVIHGYCEPSIENAVNESRYSGTVFNQPHPVIVELAESLTQTIDFADWAVFAKNGSDLTTWAIRVAREFSHRSLIIKASDLIMELMLGVILVKEGEFRRIVPIYLNLTGTI